MAVSSTSGSTSNSTTSIDVAGIVQQLMTVENRPLDVLKAKITQRNTVISDLGSIKSKVSTFQEALQSFQDPITFNTATATSSDATVLGVSASNGALKGSYSVVVSSIALASKSTVSGYASSSASAAIDPTNGFEITIAGNTFNTKGTPAGTPVINANPSLLDLKNWINGLGQSVSANIVQNGANQYSLMVQGTQTGASNAVTFTGITPLRVAELPIATTTQGSSTPGSLQTESASVVFNTLNPGQTLTVAGLTFTAGSAGATAEQVASAFAGLSVGSIAADINTSKSLSNSVGGTFTSGALANWSTAATTSATLIFTSSTPDSDVADLSGAISSTSTLTKTTIAAQDANFTVDGNAFTRSTNSVNDVLSGVTFNLLKASATPQTVTINKGADVSSSAIDILIKSYNDVMTTYKDMTANSNNSSKPGTFANSPTALSFINQIKELFAKGISYTDTSGQFKTMSLSSMGIDLQLDGTAKFNSTSYANASANGLQDILALGVKAGYISSTSNLDTFLTSQVRTGGALDSQIQAESDGVRNLTKRQDDLQTRLNAVQNNLINQYSALNALLFQLNNTSTALTSALDALTNSQSKN